jgi:hypothetical protein
MKRFALFLFACVAFSLSVEAQNNIVSSLQQSNPGQGKVTIHQDARITALLGSTYIPGVGERRVLKSAGYRIQLYAGNNTRQAKNEAQKVSDDIKQAFPDLPIYTSFNPPRWLCRVGDFRSIEEADAMMRQIKATGKFKEFSIVKDYINIPL